jgi:hypothetical protein
MNWYLKVMKQFFSMRKLSFFLGVVLVATVLTSCKKEVICECEKPEATVEVEATGITLDKSTLTLDVGEWQMLIATVLPANATDKSVVWVSHNAAIASVTDGIVFGNMPGTTTIIAKAGNHIATCEVAVKPESLVDTKWIGIDTSGNQCELTFTSATDCTLVIDGYYGKTTYSGTYTLNYTNISLKLITYSGYWNLSGTVIGDQMTLHSTSSYYIISLTKQ